MSITETKNLILRTKPLLNQLEAQLEERDRLVSVLKLDPSANDNYDLINHLNKITKNLGLIQLDLHQEASNDKVIADFKVLVAKYEAMIESLDNDMYINNDDYKFTVDLPDPETTSDNGGRASNNGAAVKSVRFKDESEEDLRNELMGTRSFKPYRDDDPTVDGTSDGDSIDDLNNHQMFAKHQQQILDQDQDLDVLHDSVKLQKSMGQNINEEIDSHLIMLNDLERGVDNSQVRLTRTDNRLTDFRSKVQENGSLITIVTLTIILILLLVVLN